MSEERLFKIISVTGAHSSVGKTTLASILLNNIPDFGAIKFTRTSLYTSVTDDPGEILQKNKDTAILSESGAEHVFWIQSPYDKLKDALHIAVGKMAHLNGIVVEGNSPVDYLKPDLVIFVIGGDGQIKPSAERVSKRADVVVINSDSSSDRLPVLHSFQQDETKIFQIDLKNKTGEIDKFITYIKKYITEL